LGFYHTLATKIYHLFYCRGLTDFIVVNLSKSIKICTTHDTRLFKGQAWS